MASVSAAQAAKIELFEKTPIPKAVLKMCVPTVLSSLVMVFYNLADTYFIGFLNDPHQTAAVTLAGTVLLAFNAVNNLFGVGGSSMMSRSLGVKDYETVKKSSAFGFYTALFCAILISLGSMLFMDQLLTLLGAMGEDRGPTRDYMVYTVMLGAVPAIMNVVLSCFVRAEGASLHASLGTMSGCIINMILDPFFILPFGLNLGAAGAGLATLIGNTCACLYYFVMLYLKRGKTFVCIHPKYMRPNRRIVKEIFGVGIPASVQNLLNVTGMTILNNFAAGYGSEAVAAMGIAHKMAMIPMQISLGIGQGVMPLVGYNFASGNQKRMKHAVVFTARIAVIFVVTAAVFYYIFSGNIIRAFMADPLVVLYGTAYLRAQSLAQPFLSVDFLGVGVYQACGLGSRSLLFAIFRKIVLEIPALLLLNYLFPIYGIAWAMLVAEVILCIAAIFCMRQIVNGKIKKKS